ncbi:methyltransferase like 17 [Phyllostomus discolor]|uniref:Methyltransferase like 17 n=1 Tax=Phyllostomus discolor TaxID=89673 RepID=A0A834BKQ8_9CHIR|nr:methyltransferase like 17 [Phyllostomus discolor]
MSTYPTVWYCIFLQIHAQIPEFQPQTLMDFGSGTGSVTWAAHSIWGQSLREYMCVDSSAAMLDLAEKLLKGGSEYGEPYVPGVFFRQFLPVSPKVQFSVVVSAFSLSELPSKADRAEVVQTLWRKTSDFLVSRNSFFPSSFKAASQFLCFSFSILELVFVFDHLFLLSRVLCPSFRITIPILYIMLFPFGLLFHV